jgi:hypothetical protein
MPSEAHARITINRMLEDAEIATKGELLASR